MESENNICTFEGCTKKAKVKGMCQNHYYFWYQKEIYEPRLLHEEKIKHQDPAITCLHREAFLDCGEYPCEIL